MTALPAARRLGSAIASFRSLASVVLALTRALHALGIDWRRLPFAGSAPTDDAETAHLLHRAAEARAAGRVEEAGVLYRDVLARFPAHGGALRALRDLAVERRRWRDALPIAERLVAVLGGAERAAESEWVAVIRYELGREALAAGDAPAAVAQFKHAIRVDRTFTPAALGLGDAHEAAGDAREAVRVWERAAELAPSLPVLARLERAYRQEGRPSRMIELYRAAAAREPGDLSIAVALGRVYFELEMLDEAADQFEKIEVRAPNEPVVHAFLGAVFERRGDTREAFEEYRRALRLGQAFAWSHRCVRCGAVAGTWADRCARCGRWNALRPVEGH